jgi:hypothetical protein
VSGVSLKSREARPAYLESTHSSRPYPLHPGLNRARHGVCARRPGPCCPIVPESTRCMHEPRQKATRPTMLYGARIWAWKASRAARRGRDGEGARLAARVAFWVSLVVRTQQHGREKAGGTGERILYAHISKYPFSPQEEEEKRDTRERRAGGAHGNWSRSKVGEERHAPY